MTTASIGRFGTLMIALTATIAVGPFLRDQAESVSTMSLLYTAVMLVGVYTVSHDRRTFLFGLCLAVPALITEWLSNFVVTTPTVVANMVFAAAFIAYVAAVVFYEVLDEDRVTFDTIFGGIAIYLMIGVIWVLAYAAVEYLEPGAYQLYGETLATAHGQVDVRYPEFIYFSFVTLTTLGYGDIVPTTPLARAVAASEAIFGQIYLTVFVARLVGLHLANRQLEIGRGD